MLGYRVLEWMAFKFHLRSGDYGSFNGIVVRIVADTIQQEADGSPGLELAPYPFDPMDATYERVGVASKCRLSDPEE